MKKPWPALARRKIVVLQLWAPLIESKAARIKADTTIRAKQQETTEKPRS
jgi:hypothetical protein